MFRRQMLLSPAAWLILLLLAGCGDPEAQKAQAFSDFLQTRVLDRPGVHIPIVSDEERASIGRFDADFAVLKGFNDDLDASVKEYEKAMHPYPQNIAPTELPKYRADLTTARDMFAHAGAALDGALLRAESARAKLKQPEIVKPKFDAAYDQFVLKPEKAWRAIIPLAIAALDREISIADFIAAHKTEIKSVGSQMQVSKPALRKELEARLATYAADRSKVEEARRNLDIAVRGY